MPSRRNLLEHATFKNNRCWLNEKKNSPELHKSLYTLYNTVILYILCRVFFFYFEATLQMNVVALKMKSISFWKGEGGLYNTHVFFNKPNLTQNKIITITIISIYSKIKLRLRVMVLVSDILRRSLSEVLRFPFSMKN